MFRVVQSAPVAGTTNLDYVNFSFPSVIRVGVHEPIIWKLVELYDSLFSTESDSHSSQSSQQRKQQSNATVQVDPRLSIGLFRVSPLNIQIDFQVSSNDRPTNQLGFLTGE